MPFLDYFRCCCCKKPSLAQPYAQSPAQVRVNHPTMVSYDFETTMGVRRAFDALPENKSIPSRNAARAN